MKYAGGIIRLTQEKSINTDSADHEADIMQNHKKPETLINTAYSAPVMQYDLDELPGMGPASSPVGTTSDLFLHRAFNSCIF